MLQDYNNPFENVQSNQFSTGDMNDPNANTSWMSGGFQPSSGTSSSGAQQGTQNASSAPSNINTGTAVNAAQTGWSPQMNGSQWGMPFGGSASMGIRAGEYNPSQPNQQWWQQGGGIPQMGPQQQDGIQPGNVGQYMPGGYDQAKWDNPNKHDEKYDLGRILSKYPPGPAGLEAALKELGQGWSIVNAKSGKIRNPAGNVLDVGFAFGSNDPNVMKWGYMPQDMGGGGMPGNSMFGMGQGQQQQQFMGQLRQPRFMQRGMNRGMPGGGPMNPGNNSIPGQGPYGGEWTPTNQRPQVMPQGPSFPNFRDMVPGGGIIGGMGSMPIPQMGQPQPISSLFPGMFGGYDPNAMHAGNPDRNMPQ